MKDRTKSQSESKPGPSQPGRSSEITVKSSDSGPYLSGGQAVADGKAVDGDLDLALVDHVNDGLSSRVHRDNGHGEGTITVRHLLTITFHLKAGEETLACLFNRVME